MTKRKQKKNHKKRFEPKTYIPRLLKEEHDNIKREIYENSDAICQSPLPEHICVGKPYLDYQLAELDHITPLSKGGTNEIDNFRILCWVCHRLRRGEEHWWGRVLANQDGRLPEGFYDYLWE